MCNGGCIDNMASASYMVTLRGALIGPAIQHPSATPHSLLILPSRFHSTHNHPFPSLAALRHVGTHSAQRKGKSLNSCDVANIISVNYVPCCSSALCFQAKLLSGAANSTAAVCLGSNLGQETHWYAQNSRIPLVRINWEGQPSGYAQNQDNWIFI